MRGLIVPVVFLSLCLALTSNSAANDNEILGLVDYRGKADTIARIEKIADEIYNSEKPEMLRRSRELLRFGEATNSILIMTYGNSLLGFSYLIDDVADSALFYMNNTISVYESRKLQDKDSDKYDWIMARTYNFLGLYYMNLQIDYYQASDCFHKALDLVNKEKDFLYPLILANINLVYFFRNDPDGLTYAQKVEEYYNKTGKAKFEAYYSMATMLYLSGDYDKAEEYLKAAIPSIPDSDGNKRLLASANTLLGKIQLAQGQIEDALNSLENASELNQTHQSVNINITSTYITFSDFYKQKGDKEKALDILLQCENLNSNKQGLVSQPELYDKISQLYEERGNFRLALKYHKEFLATQKKKFDQKKEYDMRDIQAKYQVEQYQNKIKEQEISVLERNRQVTALSIIIGVLAAGIVAIVYAGYKKNKYYSKIVQQYTEKATLNKRLQELEIQQHKYNNSTLSDSKGDDLYERLQKAVIQDKIYHDPNLTIERLATQLETNRTYLSRIINERTGMNFSQYINKQRIDEAISIMTETKGDCLLKSLSVDLGFKTTSSFYKAFSKETGISPSSFRERCEKG